MPKGVLLHGHGHQKALVGTANSVCALRLPPGYQVEQVRSGCCGMAGSFGFEKEHFQVSMAIGEQTLFPAVRAKGPDWEVAVTGVPCRQQIKHGTDRHCPAPGGGAPGGAGIGCDQETAMAWGTRVPRLGTRHRAKMSPTSSISTR